MTRSNVEPFSDTTCNPGTFGMSWIDSIIGFRFGDIMKEKKNTAVGRDDDESAETPGAGCQTNGQLKRTSPTWK